MSFTGAFHHVGLACRSIAEETAVIARLGYRSEGAPVDDPIQKVRVQFFAGAGPRIELIEPTADDSPVSGILKRGTKFYHLAYEVEDFDGAVAALEAASFRALAAAAPARAFAMRRIVFMMSSTGTVVELIAKS
jgi:methylmalonyl-CoA/ethylmalonyl-CoA epimerase